MQKNITITHDNTSLCNLPKEGPLFGKLARETCDKSSRRLDYRPKKHNAGSSGRRCLHRKFGEGPEEDPHQRSRKGQEGKSKHRKASENSRRTWQAHAMGPARRMRARQKRWCVATSSKMKTQSNRASATSSAGCVCWAGWHVIARV